MLRLALFTLALLSARAAPALGMGRGVGLPPAIPCHASLPSLDELERISEPMRASYYHRCLQPALRRQRTPSAVALLHAAAIRVFDRELHLLYRLRPVAAEAGAWQAMAVRWRPRTARRPELLAFDASPSLAEPFRGGLRRRLESLFLAEEAAARAEQEFAQRTGISGRDDGFFLLGAAITTRILDLDSTVLGALPAHGMNEARVRTALGAERDLYHTAYPELESGKVQLAASVFLQAAALDLEVLSRRALANAPAGSTGRYLAILRLLDEELRARPELGPRLQALRRSFRYETRARVAALEASLDQLNHDPSLGTKQALVLGTALAALSPAAETSRRELSLARDHLVAEERWWAEVENANHTYGGLVMNAGLALYLAGGLQGFLARYALGTAARAVLRPTLLAGLARYGSGTAHVAGTTLVVVGVPSSLWALGAVWRRQAAETEAFYLALKPEEAPAGNQRRQTVSEERWALFGAVVNLVPFLFGF